MIKPLATLLTLILGFSLSPSISRALSIFLPSGKELYKHVASIPILVTLLLLTSV